MLKFQGVYFLGRPGRSYKEAPLVDRTGDNPLMMKNLLLLSANFLGATLVTGFFMGIFAIDQSNKLVITYLSHMS